MSSNPKNRRAKYDRSALPTLGIVGVNYLRETGFLQLRDEARICYFGPADSALHRMADFSFPINDLENSAATIQRAIALAQLNGVRLDGLLSLRDPNVFSIGKICA